MKVQKSTRHSKITGDFAEHLVLYWLSKYGFESAMLDHTGIDILSRNPVTKELMGISVKSRSRNDGKEGQYLSVPNKHFKKVDEACIAFACKPYFAFVIDEESNIKVYILSKQKLLKYFPMGKGVVGWKMTKAWQEVYNKDKQIIKINFDYNTLMWW